VSFYYAGYVFNGSVSSSNLFITNHQATAEQAGWDLTDAGYELYEINLGEARLVQGLKDGLYGVKAGEECEIIFSGKYGFGNENFGIIPANSALLYKIWVAGVSND
jgi:FKBP-type peptidyl-prolyl cis-trans isomerase 2